VQSSGFPIVRKTVMQKPGRSKAWRRARTKEWWQEKRQQMESVNRSINGNDELKWISTLIFAVLRNTWFCKLWQRLFQRQEGFQYIGSEGTFVSFCIWTFILHVFNWKNTSFSIVSFLCPMNLPYITGQFVDNLIWLAPEVLTNRMYDQTVDIYAYWIIMWELLKHCDFFGRKTTTHTFILDNLYTNYTKLLA